MYLKKHSNQDGKHNLMEIYNCQLAAGTNRQGTKLFQIMQ